MGTYKFHLGTCVNKLETSENYWELVGNSGKQVGNSNFKDKIVGTRGNKWIFIGN